MSMFKHVAAFEWRFQVRSPVFWVGCGLFFLLTFGAVTVDQIQIGARGNVNVNSPFAMIQTLAIMSLFAVFVHVAMVAGAVIRDDETGFAPLLRSTRLSKGDYLFGRFTGASAAAFVVLACMPLAVLVGSWMPWLDTEKVGPFRAGDYLYALFVFALPTLLVVASAFFALATVTRSMMWSYVGAVALLVGYFVTRGLLRDPQYDTWAALADPFGLSALGIVTRYWTATERNTLLPPLTGLMLANRVLWLTVAAALLLLTWRRFRFADSGAAGGAPSRAVKGALPPPAPTAIGALPAPSRGGATARAQLWALARHDMGFVFRSPAFFVLLFIGMLNAGGGAWFTGEWYGSGSYPVTRLMVQVLQGAFNIMPVIIAIYYAGELVWRDRERRLHEIVDATAAPDWAHLLPKVVAIALVLAATTLVGVLTGIAVQLAKGYTQLEIPHYLLWFWWPTVVSAMQLAVLSVFVQVLVPQKFIGWGLMLLYVVASVALGAAGFEHNLYNYGGTSPVPLSDMNCMGRFWIGQSWFLGYWSACALLLAVLSFALWRRGTTTALRPRLARLPARLRGTPLVIASVATLAWIGSGAWIFHNTNQLNQYLPTPERERQLAEAEKALLPLETLPLPTIVGVTLDVQVFPREARVVTQGRYRMENRGPTAIGQLVVQWPERLRIDRLDLAGATLAQQWGDWPVRRYMLQPALQPGESRELAFTTTLEERGFPNSAPLVRVVANGTFVDNGDITPSLGIQRRGFLTDRSKRRKHGLPPDLRPPTLEDESGRAHSVFRADSGWVQAEIRVTTDADQTPVAPGTTVSDTVKDGRRTVLFRPDAPIQHFFSIQSARYEVRRDKLGDIDLAVYFHPSHGYNVDRMLKAMKASLALFSDKFSPYQFKQARILEFPSYADFAQSFANTIPYSENIGFIARLTDPEKIDIATYVTAHEIGHQWWGHQLVPGDQQGATMLVESFAQYSALLVMEQFYGREQMRRFLKYELDRYLRARGGEVVEELPLARVENQQYIHYQKGSLALYWLKEVVGEDVVNGALAELLKQHAFKDAPYPNTLDFLRILRARAGPQHDALITDLFEKITLWDVKAGKATSKKRADGRWDVSLEVTAKKFYADGKGVETEAPLDEAFDVGAFSAEPGQPGFDAASVIQMRRHTLRSGSQTLQLVLDREPAWVGVDPYNKRIDRQSSDNLTAVARQ
jgi:aminopeptidase N